MVCAWTARTSSTNCQEGGREAAEPRNALTHSDANWGKPLRSAFVSDSAAIQRASKGRSWASLAHASGLSGSRSQAKRS